MPDELEDPAHHEHRQWQRPKVLDEDRGDKERQRQHDQRDADQVAVPVDRVGVALLVLGNPLAPAFAKEHISLRRLRMIELRSV